MLSDKSNSDLCYVIEYTELKNEAAQVLRSRFTSSGALNIPDETMLIKEIAEQVLARPGSLRMDSWHCDTAHCLAGWATLIDPLASLIEKQASTEVAGCAVLPNYAHLFFASDSQVLELLKTITGKTGV